MPKSFVPGGYSYAYPSAARTASPTDVVIPTNGARNATIVIMATAIAATPSVVFNVRGRDQASGETWLILASAAVVAAHSAGAPLVLRIGPELTAAANTIAKDFLPAEIVIDPVHGDADSITYSVGVHLGS